MTNANRKGKDGELQAAKFIRETWGIDARRTQQYCGVAGDSDLALPCNLHVEVKRVERLNIYDAIDQATSDAKASSQIPIVLHRRNRKEWLLTLRPSDLLEVAEEIKTGAWRTKHEG